MRQLLLEVNFCVFFAVNETVHDVETVFPLC